MQRISCVPVDDSVDIIMAYPNVAVWAFSLGNAVDSLIKHLTNNDESDHTGRC